MFQNSLFRFAATLVAVALLATTAWADTITHGGTTVTVDFVTVGNPGNDGNTAVTGGRGGTTGWGSVGYNYRIGTYAVSTNQYEMVVGADEGDLLDGSSDWVGDQPAAGGSLGLAEMAMFANWLTSGDVTQGAYGIANNVDLGRVELTGTDRPSALATYATVYVLPTDDEWYKAAYHKNNGVTGDYWIYTTSSDDTPTAVAGGTDPDTFVGGSQSEPADVGNSGGLSPYGSMGMGGNIWERTETLIPESHSRYTVDPVLYSVRGGSYTRDASRIDWDYGMLSKDAWDNSNAQGFRVAALVGIPEPGSMTLLLCGLVMVLIKRRRCR